MNTLSMENCERVDKKSAALSPEEIQTFLERVPGWQLITRDGTSVLNKTFKFQNFNSALSFTNHIGQQAEDQDHHPTIITEWGQVTVTWWTHVVNGLHRNDFIMAARTDAVYESYFRG